MGSTGYVIVAVIVIIFFLYMSKGRKPDSESLPNASTTLTLSNTGVNASGAEGFSNLFPYLGGGNGARGGKRNAVGGGYPVYTMMHHTANNISLVNALDEDTWAMVMDVDSPCGPSKCKTYAIKNRGQFRTHLDNYRKWLDSLSPDALAQLVGVLSSAGLSYDFENKTLFITKMNMSANAGATNSANAGANSTANGTNSNTILIEAPVITDNGDIITEGTEGFNGNNSRLLIEAPIIEGMNAVANMGAVANAPMNATKYVVLPITSKNTPLVSSVMVGANGVVSNNANTVANVALANANVALANGANNSGNAVSNAVMNVANANASIVNNAVNRVVEGLNATVNNAVNVSANAVMSASNTTNASNGANMNLSSAVNVSANTAHATSYPVVYTLYTTYTMIVMVFHKSAGKEININFDENWTPVSAVDYLAMLNSRNSANSTPKSLRSLMM